MSIIGNYLRLLINGDKEFKVTLTTATDVASKFTSQLTQGYTRKSLSVYNDSNAGSGECYFGGSDLTYQNGMPIPKGTLFEVPVSNDLDVYFVADSGERGNLRILEVS